MWGVFRAWERGYFVWDRDILFGIEISFVSVVGARSGKLSLVILALVLAISRISSCTT